MKLVKFLFFPALVLVFAFTFATNTSAKVSVSYPEMSPSPTPMANVDSFELFWPLAPGKVMGDTLYPLKLLKEKISDFLTFGTAQKANYKVFLATKRAIEAEKLLKDGKTDLANKTLDSMNSNLSSGYSMWQSVKDKPEAQGDTKSTVGQALTKLETYFTYLSVKNSGDAKTKIDKGLETVHNFQYSLSL